MIEVILADITKVELDVIVNSANQHLIGGSGVSGAIHKAAGEELELESKEYAPLAEGKAILTKGYNLSSKHVIHTVAPKYYMMQENREELLRSCYRTSLEIADESNLKSIGFPAIGIGIYKWPVELGLTIAVKEAINYMREQNENIEKVYFITISGETKAVYEALIESLLK